MQGRIIKGIAGFYYVETPRREVYACRARGIFRLQRQKPLVGDTVSFEVTDAAEKEGNVTAIAPRKNTLARPAVANVDQVLLVVAAASPEPSPVLVDSFLVEDERAGVPTLLAFNKTDLADPSRLAHWTEIYRSAGYRVFPIAAKHGEGLASLKEALRGKTTVVAGASGVGKSTLMNALRGSEDMETGEVSRLQRGRHTTRHSELLPLFRDEPVRAFAECAAAGRVPDTAGGLPVDVSDSAGTDDAGSYLIDTPGFSSFALSPELTPEALDGLYPEFAPFLADCRFAGCAHGKEPDCGVRAALEAGHIDPSRYDTYRRFYQELKERRVYSRA